MTDEPCFDLPTGAAIREPLRRVGPARRIKDAGHPTRAGDGCLEAEAFALSGGADFGVQRVGSGVAGAKRFGVVLD
jgi:hypothetical protein